MTGDLRALADRCLADTVAYLAAHAEGGATEERDGLRLFAGGHPYPGPFCNGVVRLDAATDVATLLERARAFFAPRRRGYIIWARHEGDADVVEYCRGVGWHERPPLDGMPIIFRDRPLASASDGLPARVVETEADADAYLGILAESYGMGDAPPEILRAVFCSPAAVLGDDATAVLVEVDGRPAACGMAVHVGDLGCVMWTATSPWARGRGLGPICLTAVTNAVFEQGARAVFGQSSQMGVPRWRKLGFDVIGAYHRFLAPPAR